MPFPSPDPGGAPPGPLHGITVLDCATLFAGPLAATVLGDFGADVIKIEHPSRPDPSRTHGPSRDGTGLWWKMLGRNKHTVTLDLSRARGARILLRLVREADVLVENFRPGTLERWGLSPTVLHATNPGLVIARVTGFGQFGPYAARPGFGTLAESMSGLAAVTGQPDGPPTLPPFGLADGVTALVTAAAVQTALYHRDVHGGGGQVVDLAIIEPLLTLLGPAPLAYDQLGTVPRRTGNRSAHNAPRNIYRTRDGGWVAVSTSAQAVAERVMRLVGHGEVVREPWFGSGAGRAAHADLLDSQVADWIGGRDRAEVLKAFEDADAAVSPVYDIADVFADPQYRALDTLTTVQDPELGPLRMQNVLFRLSATPGSIRWTGRPHGQDTDRVYGTRLGLTAAELDTLRREHVI
ncbi:MULTISPECIES: CaiB/BaiF CoA transferase family protein [unclassified Streptomyces]|uniref:CaiB/BaiF CoA transferase family protein n=1 Tax=unclassified Streptomyces TaxID=2593676 RepID=UPI002DDA9AD2|nr:CoA transferase [Streptomyces sp. NBC_00151]WRZ37225.1 CoA transferase [Streptomyces sp. NBC_00151]